MSDIPSELLHEILIRLPEEFLFRLRAVCKAWRYIIDDPCFIKSHANTHSHTRTTLLLQNTAVDDTRLYSLSWDSLSYADGHQFTYITPDKALGDASFHRLTKRPVPTCNGLILTSHPIIKKNMVVCNPLTQEFHVVSSPPPLKAHRSCTREAWGLGYDSVADDYKIVMVRSSYTYEPLVYSLKSSSWSTIKNSQDFRPSGTGVYVNGALYWKLTPPMSISNYCPIVALDVATEEYRLLSQPPNFVPVGESLHLHVLDGFLACSYKSTVDRVVVWVMRENGAWTKLFSWHEFVSMSGGINLMADQAPYWLDDSMTHLWPIAYWESKGQLLFFHGQSNKFFWCDLVNHSVKIVTLRDHGKLTYYSQLCVGSLFQIGRLNTTLPLKLTAGVKKKRNSSGRRRLFEIHVGEEI